MATAKKTKVSKTATKKAIAGSFVSISVPKGKGGITLVSRLLTAIPSMAERFTSGTEYFAKTGSATTRPTDCMTGTISVLLGTAKDEVRRASASSRERSSRYRFTISCCPS